MRAPPSTPLVCGRGGIGWIVHMPSRLTSRIHSRACISAGTGAPQRVCRPPPPPPPLPLLPPLPPPVFHDHRNARVCVGSALVCHGLHGGPLYCAAVGQASSTARNVQYTCCFRRKLAFGPAAVHLRQAAARHAPPAFLNPKAGPPARKEMPRAPSAITTTTLRHDTL